MGGEAGQREGRCLHRQSQQTVAGARMDKKKGHPEVSVSQARARQGASGGGVSLSPTAPPS